MRKFIIASFSLALLVSAADAQLFRRHRTRPADSATGGGVVVDFYNTPSPKATPGAPQPMMPAEVGKKQPPTPIVEPVQQADAGRGGKIRDFIKRLLGR